MKFSLKKTGQLWLISRDGDPVVALASKAAATKRMRAMTKNSEPPSTQKRKTPPPKK